MKLYDVLKTIPSGRCVYIGNYEDGIGGFFYIGNCCNDIELQIEHIAEEYRKKRNDAVNSARKELQRILDGKKEALLVSSLKKVDKSIESESDEVELKKLKLKKKSLKKALDNIPYKRVELQNKIDRINKEISNFRHPSDWDVCDVYSRKVVKPLGTIILVNSSMIVPNSFWDLDEYTKNIVSKGDE